jgi:hypothetical protein
MLPYPLMHVLKGKALVQFPLFQACSSAVAFTGVFYAIGLAP